MLINNLSCYEEFIIRRDTSGCNTKDFLINCNNVIQYKNHYYLWTDDGLLNVFDDNGNKIEYSDKILDFYIIPKSIKICIIPDCVTKIDEYTFYNCISLKSVTIPNSVTKIGTGAFYHCKSLETVTISDNITKINDNTFAYCESLETITIPDSVIKINKNAFYCCTSLKSITIPNGITKIDDSAFLGCTLLESDVVKLDVEI